MYCCGGKTRVFMISLFTHLQFCRHWRIIYQQGQCIVHQSRYRGTKAYVTLRVLPRYTILKERKIIYSINLSSERRRYCCAKLRSSTQSQESSILGKSVTLCYYNGRMSHSERKMALITRTRRAGCRNLS
jgi:hypothetical protein